MRNFFLILKIRFQEKFDLSSRLMLFILYAVMFAGVYFAADYLKITWTLHRSFRLSDILEQSY